MRESLQQSTKTHLYLFFNHQFNVRFCLGLRIIIFIYSFLFAVYLLPSVLAFLRNVVVLNLNSLINKLEFYCTLTTNEFWYLHGITPHWAVILISIVMRASNLLFKWIHFVAFTFRFIPVSSDTIDICQITLYVSPWNKLSSTQSVTEMLPELCTCLYSSMWQFKLFHFYYFNSAKTWREEMASICIIISRHLKIPLHF